MKRVILSLMAVAIAGTVLFVACKKDPENSFLGSKKQQMMMDAIGDEGGRPFPQYENYTPPAAIMEQRLLLINNCVNNPDAEMPNMELKEAVFFLEAYFQLGVCQWQEYAPLSVDSRQTYFMTVPCATNGGRPPIILPPGDNPPNGDILLNGEVLRTQYRNVLRTIQNGIFPEYAVNIGDVFVHSVAADNVVLGLEISYGQKGQKAGEYESFPYDPSNDCYGGSPLYGRLIATDMSINPVKYPAGHHADPGFYHYTYPMYSFSNSQRTDINMTIVLNQLRTMKVPMGIQRPDKWANNPVWNSMYDAQFYGQKVYNYTTVDCFDRNFYDNQSMGYNYGEIYRNSICSGTNSLLAQAKRQGLCSADAKPLEARCVIEHNSDPGDNRGTVWHNWGLITTYRYFVYPCYVSDLHLYLQP